MPTIEVGGRKTGCRPSCLPSDTICVDVTTLPNPYTAIKNGKVDESIEGVTEWLRSKKQMTFDDLVEASVGYVLQGFDIRIVCHGGRHRSQAVANAVVVRLSGQLNITLCVLETQRLA